MALGLRQLVTALRLALAQTQLVRINRDLTVMFVIDNSVLLTAAKTRAAVFADEAANKMKQADRRGAVVFGRDAQFELAPGMAAPLEGIKTVVPGEFTDIAQGPPSITEATKRARAPFIVKGARGCGIQLTTTVNPSR